MIRLLLAAALILPTAAFAVGSGDSTPPSTTDTTSRCTDGKVWDPRTRGCVTPSQDSRLDDDTLYQAVREFAYAGRNDDALQALAAMSDQGDDRVLTYMGFVHRRMGDAELGNAYYRQALARNPDNLLARSYMGQGMAESGDMAAARLQLAEIRMRGGTGTWAETALMQAIETGRGASY